MIWSRIGKALTLFAAWFVAGWVLMLVIYESLVLTMFGGISEPPAIWTATRDFGVAFLPFLMLLGGLPTAIQLVRGRPWKKVFGVTIAISAAAYLAVAFIVFFGPEVFNWHWQAQARGKATAPPTS